MIRNAEPVVDFALGLMLDITRNITLSDKFIRNGQWMHMNIHNTGRLTVQWSSGRISWYRKRGSSYCKKT